MCTLSHYHIVTVSKYHLVTFALFLGVIMSSCPSIPVSLADTLTPSSVTVSQSHCHYVKLPIYHNVTFAAQRYCCTLSQFTLTVTLGHGDTTSDIFVHVVVNDASVMRVMEMRNLMLRAGLEPTLLAIPGLAF